MDDQTTTIKNKSGIFRIIGVIAIIVILISAIVASLNQHPSNADKVWDQQMTVGNLDAKNYFIVYSDIACPYCVAFENAIVEHEEDFNRYIEDNDILLEVRLSDFLYEYGETNPQSSRDSALAIYCARDEGRFWDYYNHAITTVWNQYFKNAGKSAVAEMSKLGIDYWINLGTKDLSFGEDFENCVRNETPLAEIEEKALKSAKSTGGLPYFKFNSFVSSGYNLDWGYDYVIMYFESGLKS